MHDEFTARERAITLRLSGPTCQSPSVRLWAAPVLVRPRDSSWGIKLMPRIRNWKDLHLYRPDQAARYDLSMSYSPPPPSTGS